MKIKQYCEVKFPDKKVVTGTVETDSLNVAGKVKYTGAVKRLIQAPNEATPSLLYSVFQATARSIGAGCVFTSEGVPFN